jgi:hypothetical protein
VAIECNRVQSIVAIKYNQSWQSSAIGCNHAPLPLDGPLLQLPLLLLLLCARRLRLADESLML